jgi:hypothetical protein
MLAGGLFRGLVVLCPFPFIAVAVYMTISAAYAERRPHKIHGDEQLGFGQVFQKLYVRVRFPDRFFSRLGRDPIVCRPVKNKKNKYKDAINYKNAVSNLRHTIPPGQIDAKQILHLGSSGHFRNS